MMNLANSLRYWAHWCPDDTFVVCENREISWRQMYRRSNRLANALLERGLSKGERVGVLSANRPEFIELILAAHKAGLILVPLNTRLLASELAYIIDDSGTRLVFSDGALRDSAEQAIAESGAPCDLVCFDDRDAGGYAAQLAADDTDPGIDVDAGDTVYICYTSGTTGKPKGAMLSHGNVLAMAQNRALADDMTSRTRLYLPFPLPFTGGLVSCFSPVLLAGSRLYLDNAVEPLRMLQMIQENRITSFAAVPALWQMMLQHPEFDRYDLSSLEVASSGGAAVPEPLLKGLQAAGVHLAQGYGLTEGAGLTCWLNAADAERKLGSCGRPLMHTHLRVVDPDRETELVDVDPGEAGELIISGPEIMQGYWNNPGANAKTLVDGWLRTGDMARIDDEGYVYIVDRSKDMIISGGLNVYPAEIESAIMSVEGVQECAVIGVAHDKWGETGLAIVKAMPDTELSTDAITRTCRDQLADFKRPHYLVWRESPLPRGMSGKVLKRELREEYAAAESWGPELQG
jgi:fatty-acyl-CoA synthase